MATEAERSLAGRIAAHTKWSKQDPVAGTAAARKGFMARFEREVDPRGEYSPEERQRRATAAMRAHMASIALRSVKARNQRNRRT